MDVNRGICQCGKMHDALHAAEVNYVHMHAEAMCPMFALALGTMIARTAYHQIMNQYTDENPLPEEDRKLLEPALKKLFEDSNAYVDEHKTDVKVLRDRAMKTRVGRNPKLRLMAALEAALCSDGKEDPLSDENIRKKIDESESFEDFMEKLFRGGKK